MKTKLFDEKELFLLESLEDFLNDPELNSLVSTAVSGSTINDPTTYAGSGYLGAANRDLDQDILKRRRELGRKIKRLWAKYSDTSFFQNELAYFHYSSVPNLQTLIEEYNSKSEISAMAVLKDEIVDNIFPYVNSYYGPIGVRLEGRVTLAANNMDCLYSGHYKKQEIKGKEGVKKCPPSSRYPGYLNQNTIEKYITDKDSYDRISASFNEAILDNSRIVYAYVSSVLRFFPYNDDLDSRWPRSTDYLSDILSLLSTCKSKGIPLFMYFGTEIRDLTKLSSDEEKLFLDTAFQLFVEEGTEPPSHSEYPDYVNKNGDIEFTSSLTTDTEIIDVTLSEQIKRMVMEELNNILIEGKKDACYHKVKSRYKKWPSAYASGALVKCRKVGAKNWGNSVKEYKQEIPGGLTSGLEGDMNDAHKAIAKKHGVSIEDVESQIEKGIEVELEHTTSKKIAHEIAMDHVWEDPKYYDKLSKVEETKKKAGTESSKEKNLRDWFKRKGAKGKTGGWVDCNTCRDGKCKPCGRQEGESRSKYPACRPTPGACKEKGRGKTWGKTSKKSEE